MSGFNIISAQKLTGEIAKESGLKNQDVLKNNQQIEKNFIDHLSESLNNVNSLQKNADSMATNLASGKTENIHETMLAVTKAELSFNLMVQVRNKALEAYQEIMRMPV